MGPPLWSHLKKIHAAGVGCMEKSMYFSSRIVVWVDHPPVYRMAGSWTPMALAAEAEPFRRL
jgi:hypothetical protein